MSPREQKEKNIELTFTLVVGLIIVTRFIASFFPAGRTWGFHHLLFFPLWLRIAFTLTALLICIPRVNKTILSLLRPLPRFLFREQRRKRYTIFIVLSLSSFIPFWLLRTKTHFLGDGYLRIRSLGAESAFSAVRPLDTFLHILGHKLLSLFGNPDPATTYALISCLSGVLFVFVLFIFSISWTQRRLQATFIFSAVITMGMMQLFFGYVENYTLMTTGILLYMFTSLLYLKNKCSILLPSLALSLTICLHTAAAPFICSLAYLVFAKKRSMHRKSLFKVLVKASAGFVFPLVGIGFLAYSFGYGPDAFLHETGKGTFLPLFGDNGTSSYSILTPPHLADFINEQVLTSPTGIITALLLLLLLRRKINFRSPWFRFLIVATSCLLGVTFLINPKLGLSRDWDLFSLPALPLTLLGVYLAISYIKDKEKLKYVGVLCITVNLLHTVPWILVNSNESKAINRFEVLVETETIHSLHYAYEELATYYINVNQPEDGIRYYQKAIEKSPSNWRLHILLGSRFGELDRYDEAITEFEIAKKLVPQKVKTKREVFLKSLLHYNLGTAYGWKEQYEKAILEYEKAIALNPENAEAHFYLGYSYWVKGRREEAVASWRRTLSIDPNHAAAREFLSKTTGD